MPRALAWLCTITCLLLSVAAWGAPTEHAREGGDGDAAPQDEDGPALYVLTFGPGDHPFSRFGHNAIAVVSRKGTQGFVYNFGTFQFGSETLISDFMQGKLMYWVSRTTLSHTIAAYRGDNRSITAQRLRLTAFERARLIKELERAILPKYRYYRYDYYLNNCSTKVRDLLDALTGGRLRAVSREPAQLTWREHTARLTSESWGVYAGLMFALTDVVDQPNTRWEEMFLPEVLAAQLRRVRTAGGEPLVSEESIWFEADRLPALMQAPRRVHWFGLLGVIVGAVGVGLARVRGRLRKPAVVVLGVLVGVVSLIAGTLGSIALSFWALTDHAVAHRNESLLCFPPWLVLVPLALAYAIKQPGRGTRIGKWLLWASLATTSVGVVAKLLPAFDQQNGFVLALAWPLWTGLGVALALVEAELRGRRP